MRKRYSLAEDLAATVAKRERKARKKICVGGTWLNKKENIFSRIWWRVKFGIKHKKYQRVCRRK